MPRGRPKKNATLPEPKKLNTKGKELLELYAEYFSTDSEVLQKMLREFFGENVPSEYLEKYMPDDLTQELLEKKQFQENPVERRKMKLEEMKPRIEANKLTVSCDNKYVNIVRMLGVKPTYITSLFEGEDITKCMGGVDKYDAMKGYVAIRSREIMSSISMPTEINSKQHDILIGNAYRSPASWINVDITLRLPLEVMDDDDIESWIVKIMSVLPENL